MSLILGIDASPKRLAYALSAHGQIVHHELIHTPASWHIVNTRRLAWVDIRMSVRKYEEEFGRDITTVAIEDVHVGVNRRGSLDHALCVGQMMAWSYVTFPDAEQLMVQPQSWRKWCELPRAGKEAPKAFADQYVGYTVASQDEADAICIAVAADRSLRASYE